MKNIGKQQLNTLINCMTAVKVRQSKYISLTDSASYKSGKSTYNIQLLIIANSQQNVSWGDASSLEVTSCVPCKLQDFR